MEKLHFFVWNDRAPAARKLHSDAGYMKTLLLLAALAAVAVPGGWAWADQGRHGGDDEGKHHGRGHDRDRHEGEYAGRYFRSGDREIIVNYYGGPKGLPPGLARKLERTGTLPPGWEKRFRPMPVVVERQLPPICATCRRGIIDGCAVVYDRRTRVILDVLALAGDLAR